MSRVAILDAQDCKAADGGSMKEKKLLHIQFLRFVAALLVVLRHSHLITKQYHGALSFDFDGDLFLGGIVGVDIFFIVSGYIIGSILLVKNESVFPFLVKRVFRIYPVYWVFTGFVCGAYFLNHQWNLGGFPVGWPRFWKSFVIFPQVDSPILGVGWTLEHEVVFYLIAAFFIFIRAPRLLWIVLLAFGLIGVGYSYLNSDYDFAGKSLFSVFQIEFAIGFLFFAYEKKFVRPAKPIWFLLAVFALLLSMHLISIAFFKNELYVLLLRSAVASIFVFATISCWKQIPDWLGLNSVAKIGDWTYGLYLSHWLVISVIGKLIAGKVIWFWQMELIRVLAILLAIACSKYVYIYLEMPCIRMGHRVSQWLARSRGALL